MCHRLMLIFVQVQVILLMERFFKRFFKQIKTQKNKEIIFAHFLEIKIIECTQPNVDIFIILIRLMGNHYHVSDRQDKTISKNKKKHQSILEIY